VRLYTSVIELTTRSARELVDITSPAAEEVARASVRTGLCALYAQGATAALMIQENDDPNIRVDVLDCLDRLVPAGAWRHDRIDGNGAAHIQAGLVGPSEAIPIRDGRLALSTWQNVFFCEFDGPRPVRRVVVTIVGEP
jgi:secondary thiamine-phosphate synthase enzyme